MKLTLDTNVLVYAVDLDAGPSRRLAVAIVMRHSTNHTAIRHDHSERLGCLK